MNPSTDKLKDNPTIRSVRNGSELRIKARVVSRGVAVGTAVCLHGRKRQFYRLELPPNEIDSELNRLKIAVAKAAGQLESLIEHRPAEMTDAVADILGVHLLLIRESSLISNCAQAVAEEGINAEWAVKLVSEEYLSRYRAISDEHLREKSVDLEDVTERILNALGVHESYQHLPKDAIIVATEIRPSTMLEFLRERPAALVTEHGGWTSHVFIMAREMGIPALAGVSNLFRRVKTGELVGVDAVDGELVVRPSQTSQSALAAKFGSIDAAEPGTSRSVGTVQTLDGKTIRIAANVDKPDACERAVEMGTSGIGLLRTEYLFEHINALPSERTQTAAYTEVATIAGAAGIRIRTFDLGIEQTSSRVDIRETNPALGLRAIRLSLVQERQFRVQIRSILKASFNAAVSIVLPLVSGVEDIRRALGIIKDEWANLQEKGLPCGQPQVGAMVELPSAVFSINEILRYVDFVCLGTNDLVQYIVGVDRDNESVAEWYQTLHPAVIRAISTVLAAAKAANIPAVVCGEMAGSPFYTPLLIGLGATDFSMNLHSIGPVRKLIAGISYDEAVELAARVGRLETANEIEDLLVKVYSERWRRLFPQEILSKNIVEHHKNISKN